ncbi:unnamed protein product [Moneuplotes crassus]|uniref:F-box domain-containing protein n=1 Tax=Euplotes crassus TaxID=5936 RepID=A0AAD1UIA4_EUPCR|nr:unnamed protein product [Moneuplotes crassus]
MGCACGTSKSKKKIKKKGRLALARPKFYNILLANGGRLRYRRTIIQVLFSYLSFKDISTISRVSRRLYYITGLKEVLIHFTHVENPEGNIMISADHTDINNTVVIERTTNENDPNGSFDIIVDQYARPILSCGSNIFPKQEEKLKAIQELTPSSSREHSVPRQSFGSNSKSDLMQKYIKEGCNIMTPYWSVKSSSNKDLSIDQILLGDTGGPENVPNSKFLIKNMDNLNRGSSKLHKSSSLKSVRKRLNFKSRDFDIDFCESIKEEAKEDTSVCSPKRSYKEINFESNDSSDQEMSNFLAEKKNWDRVIRFDDFDSLELDSIRNPQKIDKIGPIIDTSKIKQISRIDTISGEKLPFSSTSKRSDFLNTFGGSQEYQNPFHCNTLNN